MIHLRDPYSGPKGAKPALENSQTLEVIAP